MGQRRRSIAISAFYADQKGARELTAEDNDTFDEYIRSQNITSYDASYPMFRWHVDIKASILSAQIPGEWEM